MKSISLAIFLALCLSLAIAPGILAAGSSSLSRGNAYALGILAIVTLGLAIYLFFVIFQPEKF